MNIKEMIARYLNDESSWIEYCLDEAVMIFGSAVESKLEERDPTTHKPLFTLRQVFDICLNKNKPRLIDQFRIVMGNASGVKIEEI